MAQRKKLPDSVQEVKEIPAAEPDSRKIPDAEQAVKAVPSTEMQTKEIPMTENPENTVVIGGRVIEIKPTKLKYQRTGIAEFFRFMEIYPLTDILAMDKDFGDGRDGDKAVMDWLIAVTDDPDLIVENYDEIDTGTVEKMISIFRRVNKIDEKETKRKNVLTPGEKG